MSTEKSIESFVDLYNQLEGLDLTSSPALLFFFNATANATSCQCKGKLDIARDRYRTLMTYISDDERRLLYSHFNVNKLVLVDGSEKFIINLP